MKISWDDLEAIGKYLEDGKDPNDPIFKGFVELLSAPFIAYGLKEAAKEIAKKSKKPNRKGKKK